ncbi:lipase family protein [Streptomyces sp. URMC 129]|uniref:lipase family protein n=1 Tax=Streptomyces sp. URMC 129 TaxID=3423407 RepID=UPI003F1C5A49
MTVSILRRLGWLLATLAALGVMILAPSSATAEEDFYLPPSPLPAGEDGDVIRAEPVRADGARVTRIMYRSRDAHDRPVAVTGTVVVPDTPWTGPGPRPIVAFAPGTVGLGDQCAVSRSPDTGDYGALLDQGIAVAQTDYEGMGTPGPHTYAVRDSLGHAVLDVIRAAQRLPGSGLPANGPVGITGFSLGGAAAGAAAELAATYAPELDLRGAYVGAVPADPVAVAGNLDGTLNAALLLFALTGLEAAYPELGVSDGANALGRAVLEEAATLCADEALPRYAFRHTSTLTADHGAEGTFRTVVEANTLGNVAPAVPTLVEHAPGDDVVPYEQARRMARDWCAGGATVQFGDLRAFLPVLQHVLAAPGFPQSSVDWLTARFHGDPAPTNCGAF